MDPNTRAEIEGVKDVAFDEQKTLPVAAALTGKPERSIVSKRDATVETEKDEGNMR